MRGSPILAGQSGCRPCLRPRPVRNIYPMKTPIALVLALCALAPVALAQAGEAKILWSRERCEMLLVQKPDGEVGVILQLSEGRAQIGDELEGDFDSINSIRKMKNRVSGEEIMMRGVRYSSSRKYVLEVMPKWCKAPKE